MKLKKKKKKLSGKARARVLIAKDVLKYIDSGDIIPAGSYFEFKDRLSLRQNRDKELKVLIEEHPQCRVCGIGAALYAQVRRFDEVKVGDLACHNDMFGMACFYSTDMRRKLAEIFTPLQIATIEAAYEQSICQAGGFANEAEVRAASVYFYHFYENHSPRDFRMKVIFRNIIENDGTFKPDKKVKVKV